MASSDITVEPLDRQHDRAAFHCGAEALDRYLKQQARQDADKRVAVPFVAVSPPNARVLGYYTLSASVLTLTGLPDELASCRAIRNCPSRCWAAWPSISPPGVKALGNICSWMA